MINADEPLGWDNQLPTEPLLNLNYTFKRKLVSAGEYATKGFTGDFAIGLEYKPISHTTVFGFHADHGRYAIHFNFYKYNDLPFESVNPLTGLTWGNITFEYRF